MVDGVKFIESGDRYVPENGKKFIWKNGKEYTAKSGEYENGSNYMTATARYNNGINFKFKHEMSRVGFHMEDTETEKDFSIVSLKVTEKNSNEEILNLGKSDFSTSEGDFFYYYVKPGIQYHVVAKWRNASGNEKNIEFDIKDKEGKMVQKNHTYSVNLTGDFYKGDVTVTIKSESPHLLRIPDYTWEDLVHGDLSHSVSEKTLKKDGPFDIKVFGGYEYSKPKEIQLKDLNGNIIKTISVNIDDDSEWSEINDDSQLTQPHPAATGAKQEEGWYVSVGTFKAEQNMKISVSYVKESPSVQISANSTNLRLCKNGSNKWLNRIDVRKDEEYKIKVLPIDKAIVSSEAILTCDVISREGDCEHNYIQKIDLRTDNERILTLKNGYDGAKIRELKYNLYMPSNPEWKRVPVRVTASGQLELKTITPPFDPDETPITPPQDIILFNKNKTAFKFEENRFEIKYDKVSYNYTKDGKFDTNQKGYPLNEGKVTTHEDYEYDWDKKRMYYNETYISNAKFLVDGEEIADLPIFLPKENILPKVLIFGFPKLFVCTPWTIVDAANKTYYILEPDVEVTYPKEPTKSFDKARLMEQHESSMNSAWKHFYDKHAGNELPPLIIE